MAWRFVYFIMELGRTRPGMAMGWELGVLPTRTEGTDS